MTESMRDMVRRFQAIVAARQVRSAVLALAVIAMTGDLTLAQFFPEAKSVQQRVAYGDLELSFKKK